MVKEKGKENAIKISGNVVFPNLSRHCSKSRKLKAVYKVVGMRVKIISLGQNVSF